MPEQRKGVRDVKSAARTVEVLEVLGNLDGQPISLRQLAERMDVPRSSLYALLQTLVNRGWVRTDPTNSLYAIGVRALLVGTSYLDGDPRLAAAKPHLDDLGERLGETVHFARLDNADVVYLATRPSQHYLRPFSRVGRRLPAYATSLGKAILAERTDAEVEKLLPPEMPALTEHTLDRPGLLADLAGVRARGYAIDNEEGTVGLRCFGMALRYETPVIDAISCSVPIARLSPEMESAILEALSSATAAIEVCSLSAGRGIAGASRLGLE
ncbi:IclR family transcriptional regulator [Amycolatopsis alkalitolerans]|uniref:Glycerol operon regulatory protein n=1 Tax=Amycolatopsis alkalitolerans TaxID=2547244 RepID=A0A5C4M5M4_9PSEU|nr:IclR family transcriptional regulator [Amycolatopsis alkalitolerans]TNC28462.1 IclR family transcriptional regulator [Amycolatopsis alkalitolerans]